MMGLHPCDVSEENYKHEIAHVEEELANRKIHCSWRDWFRLILGQNKT